MTWFRVDDDLPFHPKVIKAGNEAMGLWVRAGSWSSQHLTDGFVPDAVIRTISTESRPDGSHPRTNTGLAKRLIDAGLWSKVAGGCQFHEWNENGRQPTRDKVKREREAARERMRNLRGSPEQPPNTARTSNERSPELRDPVPSRPSYGLGSQSSTGSNARGTDGLSDEDIDKIAHLMRTSRSWAAETAKQILARANGTVTNPGRYVLKAIEKEPGRYRPELRNVPPMFGAANTCPTHPSEYADNCRGCAADKKAAS